MLKARLPTRSSLLRAAVAAVLVMASGGVALAGGDVRAHNAYRGMLLVTDVMVPTPTPTSKDPNLASPRGLVHGDNGAWWVANYASETATAYMGTGRPVPYVVLLPGAPTGIAFNEGDGFLVPTDDDEPEPADVLFATEDGTISAWNPLAWGPSGPEAVVMIDRSDEQAIYRGLTIAETSDGPHIYATDSRNARVDVFDAEFDLVDEDSFVDESIPSNYAPFGIRAMDGVVFVTYALRADFADSGGGYVDAFDEHGKLLGRVATMGRLAAPAGLAMAPDGFGAFGGNLLVGQYGSGEILAFDADTYEPRGVLRNPHGQPIAIPGLRGIDFGNGHRAGPANALYFVAETGSGVHGRFGVIVPSKTAPVGTVPVVELGP